MVETFFIQCSYCGQVVTGTNPRRLLKVCLDCCERQGENGDINTPYIVFKANTPIEVYPCPEIAKNGIENAPATECIKC